MNKLVLLLALLPFFATSQNTVNVPPPEHDYEATSNYKDSLERHKSIAMQYRPHACKNRHGKFGWVGKMHQTIIPFEYDQLPQTLRSLNAVYKNGNAGAIDPSGRVVVPFNYGAVNISMDGKRAYTHARTANAWGAWNAEGKQILPEKYQNLSDYIVGRKDSLIKAYDRQTNKFMLFDHQGKMVYSNDYEYYQEMAPGRFLASKRGNEGYVNGVLDSDGKVLAPIEFKEISWVSDDYAAIQNSNGERGLFKFSTQKFTAYPYSLSKPDANGNFVISAGQHWGDGKLGLVNANFESVYPNKFQTIHQMGQSKSYLLSTPSGLSGIGDAQGKILLDTMYKSITQSYIALDNTKPINLGTKENIHDLPFYLFGEIATTYPSPNAGLWHEQKGKVCDPKTYQLIYPVSDQNYVGCNQGDCALRSLDGKLLSKKYIKFELYESRFLIGQVAVDQGFEMFNTAGQVLSSLPSLPESLGNNFSAVKAPKGYALFDSALKQISDFKYSEIKPLDQLDSRFWKEAATNEATKGFSNWVAFAKEGPQGTILLLDSTGKAYKVSAN